MNSQLYRQRSRGMGVALLALPLFLSGRHLVADEVVTFSTVEGEVQSVQATPASSPPQPGHGRHGPPPGAQPAGPSGEQPGQPSKEGKPDEGDKKKEGEGGEKKGEAATSVKRPDKPPRVPDPREFDVKLDKGFVPAFNFIGQPWPDVLQWLANISKCSLDWQELPNDFLNLTTQRPYTVDEVRDLINRHLNARGYTAIQSGEVLSVFKIDKLDPSLVRRVTEEQLYDLKPYDFVKVSFELPQTMEVDKAKDDVKQILSPTAKIFPLVSSNRLLVMDSVANLRTVSELLNQERMIQDGRIVPKEIVLKYSRPQRVIEILYLMLGVDPKGKPAQTDPQVQQQQMQMMQQMQQQGRDVSKMMPKADAPKVYLAYNRQRNSVLINAPPDQLKVIEQTIAYLDVPFGGDATGEVGNPGNNPREFKKYALTNLDPDKFVSMLEEIGGLSPSAELKVDDDSKTLFAMATPADQTRISSLIDQFDGSGRQFEVIQLRRLPADAVAASIFNLMGGQTEKKEDQNQYRPWYYDMDDRQEKKKKQPVKGFGVDADIEHNRLLFWANEAEMKRVHDLLVKLGEIPSGQQGPRPVRLIVPTDPKETAALLEKLRAAWPAGGGNELIIKAPAEKKPAAVEKQEPAEKPKPAPAAGAAADRATDAVPMPRVPARFAQLDEAATTPVKESVASDAAATTAVSPDVPAESADKQAAPPVTITITDDGRLMLSSPDTAALDRLEEMIQQLTPPEKRFKIFQCKYIRASEMFYDLKDYFKDDLEEKKNDAFSDYFWGYRPRSNNKEETGTGLSKRRKLMITYDGPSNSILVANASASQLAEIQQLIEQFDKPAPSDSVEIRKTAAIKIQYSRPTVIAAAVKEVYRDLLSKRDKEFDRGDKREERASSERMTVINYGDSSGDEAGRPTAVKIGFDGALSMGADDVSGVLIISAQKALFDDIVRMVHELDNEAAPKTTVQVHHVNGNVSAKSIQQALEKAVGKAWLGNRPEQQPAQTGQDGNKKPGENKRGGKRGGEQQSNDNSGNAEAASE